MADKEQAQPTTIKLDRVRMSFPDIWKPKAIKKDDEPKFSAAFLLDKKDHAEMIKHIKSTIWAMALNAFGGKPKATEVVTKGNICLHEGSEKAYDGYGEHNMFLSTSTTRRPAIVDRDRTPLVEDDQKPYAGCYVNAVVQLWAQNNEYGKRINCELLGVQFVSDGEPFGKPPFNPDEHFTDLDEGKTKPAGKKASNEAAGKTDGDDEEMPF